MPKIELRDIELVGLPNRWLGLIVDHNNLHQFFTMLPCDKRLYWVSVGLIMQCNCSPNPAQVDRVAIREALDKCHLFANEKASIVDEGINFFWPQSYSTTSMYLQTATRWRIPWETWRIIRGYYS